MKRKKTGSAKPVVCCVIVAERSATRGGLGARAWQRLNRADRVVIAIVIVSAILSAALVLRMTDSSALAAGFGGTAIVLGALLLLFRQMFPHAAVRGEGEVDWTLVREAAAGDSAAIAITDRKGRLVCTNAQHDLLFDGVATPPALPVNAAGVALLTQAGKTAWREGHAAAGGIVRDGRLMTVTVVRTGAADDCLIWRVSAARGGVDTTAQAVVTIDGEWGARLGDAGVMLALIGAEGRVRAANRPLIVRATGRAEAPVVGRDFVTLLSSDAQGRVRFAFEGATGTPLRLIHIPIDPDAEDGVRIVALIDEDGLSGAEGADVPLQKLLSILPLGLALADRDGRFLFMNQAFARAANVAPGATPVYPGDLVVREDKAAVADAVRRFAAGKTASGDLAVRLRDRPEDPVVMTLAGARGLGEAAVLLSLKDNSEESRLKREIAQATKMQAVGQLAGGVAHDFNNILTAIIGHCDLMLMRHTPGDTDYDDIQQIRGNSNRAAALTRQLLAFSRQQTLRPQILQLPDVIAEVSNLLQRLLGETVTLAINHGRDLGAVRADPGQLEQVIVNLAVNARDAMPAGGTVTLQTYGVSAADVRKLGSDIMPIVAYTALRLSDTGTGIPPEILPKVFEPFFTTKEVGKGTGLGLSTVYGIVKQSNGFIFADSLPGKGTSFVIYLPVHEMEAQAPVAVAPRVEKPADLWGSGTILVVEDEDMVRNVAERALARHGYTVLTAAHGEEALEILGRGDPVDLLISDVVMPTMDGPTMVRHARERFPDMPILFMSGYAEEQLRKSIDLDRVSFLPKPFSVKQLAEAARDALNSVTAKS
jgi:two-component system, cell cycle sensor histidine kinase and response regulator CckA